MSFPRLRVPRVVWVLASGRFVTAIASFGTLYSFLYLTGPRDLPMSRAGLISGVAGLGVIAGNFTGGWLSDRYGHRRTMLLSSTVGGLCLLAVPWAPVAAVAVLLPVASYATGAAGVAQGAMVAEAVPVGERRTSIAVFRAASNAGFVIGPPLGAVLVSLSYTWLYVTEAVMVLAVRAVTARLLPVPDKASPARHRGAGLWRGLRADPRLLAFLPAVAVVDLVYRQLYSTLPVFLRDAGHGVGLYATLIAVGSGLILCLEVPVAVVLRRLPALFIVGTGYALVGIGFGLFGFGGIAAAVAAMVVLTAGEILYKTTATAHVVDSAPPHLTARYQGLYTTAAISGMVVAPPVGSAVYAAAPALLWPLCTVAALTAAAATWAIGLAAARRRRTARAEGAAEEEPVPRPSPAR